MREKSHAKNTKSDVVQMIYDNFVGNILMIPRKQILFSRLSDDHFDLWYAYVYWILLGQRTPSCHKTWINFAEKNACSTITCSITCSDLNNIATYLYVSLSSQLSDDHFDILCANVWA